MSIAFSKKISSGLRRLMYVFCLFAFVGFLFPHTGTAALIPPSDEQITGAIERSLTVRVGGDTSMIQVKTQDGIVTLSGIADDLMARERVVDIAQTIQGVRSVVDNLHLAGLDRPDPEILKALKKAVQQDLVLEGYSIQADVKDGIAVLQGRVETHQEKELASDVAKAIQGVRAVNNDLEVEQKWQRSDSEIQAEIERRLQSNVWIFEEGITVRVREGTVFLDGTVASEAERKRVLAVTQTKGVREVDDRELKINTWIRGEDLRRTKPVSLDDDAIQEAVTDALALDPRIESDSIQVRVEEGLVYLNGTVEHYLEKFAAEEDASNTVGVKRTINGIQVKLKESRRSDSVIRHAAEMALANHPVTEGLQPKIQVQDKNVAVEGEVRTLYEKAWVERIISRIPEVQTIENRLNVQSSWPKKTDEAIARISKT